MEVKTEEKPKKSRVKKPKIPINMLSDEDSTDESNELSTKRQEEIKLRIAERRVQVINSCRTDQNESTEDVFNDNKSSKADPKNKTSEDVNELRVLLDDIKALDPKTDDNNVTNDSIVIESEEEVCVRGVASNTRSRGGRGRRKKAIPKKMVKKKVAPRRSGRKSKEFDTASAYETLDGYQAMDEVEVVEEFNTSLNVSQDEEGQEQYFIRERDIEIKVKYKAVIEKFTIKSTEKFSKIMPIIAQKFKENVSELMFRLNDRIIDSDSTPQAIGLTVTDIILCLKPKRVDNNERKDPNVLSLKLRDKTMKSAETLSVNKFDKIQVLVDWFAKFKGIPAKKFRLNFDGERLEAHSTVAECDIEDDSQIDVILL